MAKSNKIKTDWKKDVWLSVGEQDVSNLRSQLNRIKVSVEPDMKVQRKDTIVK